MGTREGGSGRAVPRLWRTLCFLDVGKNRFPPLATGTGATTPPRTSGCSVRREESRASRHGAVSWNHTTQDCISPTVAATFGAGETRLCCEPCLRIRLWFIIITFTIYVLESTSSTFKGAIVSSTWTDQTHTHVRTVCVNGSWGLISVVVVWNRGTLTQDLVWVG